MSFECEVASFLTNNGGERNAVVVNNNNIKGMK
jgi:hypothetical protein